MSEDVFEASVQRVAPRVRQILQPYAAAAMVESCSS